MQFETEYITSSQAVIHPSGRMDVESSPALRQALLDLAEANITTLVVDLAQVDFMDSSGLSALVSGMKALQKNGGSLRLCNINAQVRTALRLTMLDRALPAYESVEEALNVESQ